MRALLLLALITLVFGGRHHSGSNPDSKDDSKIKVGGPSSCALFPIIAEDLSSMDPSPEDDNEAQPPSNSFWYDPAQFIPAGGFYANGEDPTYHFSFCKDTPNPHALEFCGDDSAVCMVHKGVGTTLGSFESATFSPRQDHKKGFIISYSVPSHCANGTVTSFVMNCSRNYDPETNYTVSSAVASEDGCSLTFVVQSPAACPITAVEEYYRSPRNFHSILMIAGIVSLFVLVCSCCIMCCVCRKVARERCAAKKGACNKKKTAAAPTPAPVAAPVAPRQQPVRQPQPPVTPPPQAQQFQPQQFPGYFVPAPQGMAPMYPNLYNGGYMPLVPMMPQAPAAAPSHNPFLAPVNHVNVNQRVQQEAEDERLARALQAQFNQEQV